MFAKYGIKWMILLTNKIKWLLKREEKNKQNEN